VGTILVLECVILDNVSREIILAHNHVKLPEAVDILAINPVTPENVLKQYVIHRYK
jgi:hypothetical protein